jgi:hypothetical protein
MLANESAGLAEPPTGTLITEASPVPAKTSDGRYRIRIITAGEGSSAIYPPAVLEQAAKDRIFPAGTRIHLDHPRESDIADLPARSVKDWCAVLTEDAVYDPTEQALDADAKVFRPYQVLIEDLKDYVGMSVHAWIETTATPGKPVATRFLASPHNTVDFVTAAGRGGKVLEVLESASAVEATSRDRREQLSIAVKAAYQTEPNAYFWVRDFDETTRLVWFEDNDDRCWEQAYTVSDDDLTVALTGDPIEVRPVVQYVPVTPPTEGTENESTTTEGDAEMDTKELEAQIEALRTQVSQLTTENKDLAAWKRDRVNGDKAREALPSVEGYDKLPAPAQSRIAATVTVNVPATEAGDFDAEQFNKLAAAAVKTEADYLAQVAPADERIHGFGDTRPTSEANGHRTHDAWGDPIKNVKEH